MKILDDKSLQVIWSWSELDRAELEQRFKKGVLALLQLTQDAGQEGSGALKEGGREALAEELAEAGAVLDECAANCMSLASALRAESGEAEGRMPQRLEQSVGQKVVLPRTNVKELQEGALLLEEVREDSAVIGKGEEYWQTPLNRLFVLPREAAGGEGDGGRS